MPNLFRPFLCLAITVALGGCAVIGVGTAAVSVVSTGVSAATTVGGLAVDGTAAAARAGANAMRSDDDKRKSE